jgi:hypothetical protein
MIFRTKVAGRPGISLRDGVVDNPGSTPGRRCNDERLVVLADELRPMPTSKLVLGAAATNSTGCREPMRTAIHAAFSLT